MANQTQADGGTRRITDDLSLAEVEIGDRIDPEIIPGSEHLSVGDSVDRTMNLRPDEADGRTFDVVMVAKARDNWGDTERKIVYQPATDLFAVLSCHTQSGAMNQHERDYSVRAVGGEFVVEDFDGLDVPEDELGSYSEREYVEEWLDVLAGEWKHGECINEIEDLDGTDMKLYDIEGRRVWISFSLEGDA